jgi:hypothetical protein
MNMAPWDMRLVPVGEHLERTRPIELAEGRNLITAQSIHRHHNLAYGSAEDQLCYIFVEQGAECHVEPIGHPDIELNRSGVLRAGSAILRENDEIAFLLPFAVSWLGVRDFDCNVNWFRYKLTSQLPSSRNKRPSSQLQPALTYCSPSPKRYKHDKQYLTRLQHLKIKG